MAKKTYLYTVECTRPIALEMCRYEGAKIVGEELIDDKGERMVAKGAGNYSDQWNKYIFAIESENLIVGRWKSFGVQPYILEFN